ncbi:YheV family putative metal-binding protein [Permianibacter sp. IMCC34836]|nr:YheV family putative metal-binding protein [Permianibacter fluminis]
MNDTPPSAKPTPRRFIAGAKCPACGLEDKIVMYRINEQKFYECVKCGHKEAEAQPEPVAAVAKPKTPASVGPLEQVLTFHPAPKKAN